MNITIFSMVILNDVLHAIFIYRGILLLRSDKVNDK